MSGRVRRKGKRDSKCAFLFGRAGIYSRLLLPHILKNVSCQLTPTGLVTKLPQRLRKPRDQGLAGGQPRARVRLKGSLIGTAVEDHAGA